MQIKQITLHLDRKKTQIGKARIICSEFPPAAVCVCTSRYKLSGIRAGIIEGFLYFT